mmetsp:Transcript_24987/g.69969  ORF Transcript_24987/g.69969 Transcript_24987/m.69969 type:complete len:350 (+) Transcript_24987:717-1766(+)
MAKAACMSVTSMPGASACTRTARTPTGARTAGRCSACPSWLLSATRGSRRARTTSSARATKAPLAPRTGWCRAPTSPCLLWSAAWRTASACPSRSCMPTGGSCARTCGTAPSCTARTRARTQCGPSFWAATTTTWRTLWPSPTRATRTLPSLTRAEPGRSRPCCTSPLQLSVKKTRPVPLFCHAALGSAWRPSLPSWSDVSSRSSTSMLFALQERYSPQEKDGHLAGLLSDSSRCSGRIRTPESGWQKKAMEKRSRPCAPRGTTTRCGDGFHRPLVHTESMSPVLMSTLPGRACTSRHSPPAPRYCRPESPPSVKSSVHAPKSVWAPHLTGAEASWPSLEPASPGATAG